MAAVAGQPPPQHCAPFLRWAGSKRRMLPILRQYWTARHRRYIEPFAGSACLFFALCPPAAVLSDLNADLIGTFAQVRRGVGAVLSELRAIPPASKAAYQRLRAVDPLTLPASARAARFIYLNRYCFNGIYRTNLAGRFNVPYSGVGCGKMPDDAAFRRCAMLLRSAQLVSGDFESVLARARRGDFVYMDPPFAVRGRRVFREYGPKPFAQCDVVRLRRWMERLDRRGVTFLLSYAESEEADLLRMGFSHRVVPVRRHVAGFAAHRGSSSEVLISND